MQIGNVVFDVGSVIKLRTQNIYDQNVYSGEVSAICKYKNAANEADVASYHANVAKTVPTLGLVGDMLFIALETETEGRVYIAVDWVDVATIQLVSAATTVDIRIHDIEVNSVAIAQMRQVLTDAGYRNTLI